MPERKALSKRLRFEIFKRDSFTCQYCGAKAPDVVLHVDHIVPVAEGGEDNILNLVTACIGCNLGKSDRRLDDLSSIHAQRKQLEELQERREQLEMMVEWQRSLVDVERDEVNTAAEFWFELAPGFTPNENGRNYLDRLIKKYGFEEVLEAMRTSVKVLEFDDNGNCTIESWERGFNYIGRVLRVDKAAEEDPYARDVAYIIGILKKRLRFVNYKLAGVNIRATFTWDVSFEQVKRLAVSCRNWGDFNTGLGELIAEKKLEMGEE